MTASDSQFFALWVLGSHVNRSQLEKKGLSRLMIHDAVSTDGKDVQILNLPPTLGYQISIAFQIAEHFKR